MDLAQQLENNMQIGAQADHQFGKNSEQLLTFILAGEEYGVDILRVQEIKGWDSVTPIPNTPKHILGVINLRGTIVPIIDLRLRFNLDSIAYGPTTVVIMLKVMSEERSRTMGIVVDGVSDVYNIANSEIKDAPDFGTAVDTKFVKGLTTVNEKMVILLDIDHMCNSAELMVMDAISE